MGFSNFKQKETRYVIERVGSMDLDVFRVVDTIDEIMQVTHTLDDDFESEWNDFINDESNVYNDDSWRITRCKKMI